MEANDQTIRFRPVSNLPEWEKMLRVQLILEEAYELAEALGIEVTGRPTLVSKTRDLDPVQSLDALTDLLYVIFGTYHTLGLARAARDAFTEVHASNMSKLGPDGHPLKNELGKVMKGPNYFPPDLKSIVARHSTPPTVFDSPESMTDES